MDPIDLSFVFSTFSVTFHFDYNIQATAFFFWLSVFSLYVTWLIGAQITRGLAQFLDWWVKGAVKSVEDKDKS